MIIYKLTITKSDKIIRWINTETWKHKLTTGALLGQKSTCTFAVTISNLAI